tara:strand:+ start:111378 stop:112235 length:858 start_codon:yes stop_codon:yes gene_type:complete
MANLKEIRNRISSVSSTMQITSAMKMVSAAKLKKAQDAIIGMRPYAEKLNLLLENAMTNLDDHSANKFFEQRPVKTVLVVAITSNRGLCGAFNSNVIKKVNEISNEHGDKEVVVITIGKKGNDILTKNFEILSDNSSIFDDLTFENVSQLTQVLIDKFESGAVDRIQLVYNKFKNAATQIITKEQFLPIANYSIEVTTNQDYIFEPSARVIIKALIPKFLKAQLFKAIKESFASEHGARMTAMHKATDNATELRDQLKLTYNKARQAAITNEILEIVGGAEALKN